jgi:hypothetical protein
MGTKCDAITAGAHQEIGDPPANLPPAVAMAMPIPRTPGFTDARGMIVRLPPDDVA